MGFIGEKRSVFFSAATVVIFFLTDSSAATAAAQQPAAPAPSPAQAALTQNLGTVKAISGNVITLTLDAGNDVTVNVQDTTKIVQVAPGQKDLKTGTPIQVTDWRVGD